MCGSQLNKFQVDLLLRTCQPKEIVVCFDKEELPGEDKYFNKLWNMCKKYSNYCNFSFIYDRENLLGAKKILQQIREKRFFLELLKRRVYVK